MDKRAAQLTAAYVNGQALDFEMVDALPDLTPRMSLAIADKVA